MLDIDRWQEIGSTIRHHKLRTALTGLSVAWGIFMLVILLAAGKGLQNTAAYGFRDDAVNSIWVRSGRTTKPYRGRAVGREIQFTTADYDAARDRVPGIDHISARLHLWGEFTVTYKNQHASFDIRACHPDHLYIERTTMVRGRFINQRDLDERRKVAVIGTKVVDQLFGDEDPIGKIITIGSINYKVVGIYEDEGGEGELRKIYLPITTAQMAYGGGDRIDMFMFTVGDAPVDEAKRIEQSVRRQLARRHAFDPDDPRALWIRNNLENYEKITSVLHKIDLFVWLIGIGTILAGIVGVSNIMLISVKERTKEFGVRKAVGATPGSIVTLVVQEALLLTSVSGYFGLVAGVGLVEAINAAIPDMTAFRHPDVDVGVAAAATAILVVAGVLAGIFPAWRAARIRPVVALRDE
ncbi:MAG: ABC transporter permease [Deltaproteobacteria bacterium]|nr:MAG: ABC transporter permease [Deltaproteobacteria bacterium]